MSAGYGQQIIEMGRALGFGTENDPRRRAPVPVAGAPSPARVADRPAAMGTTPPAGVTRSWRDQLREYLATSSQQLGRIPGELAENVGDLVSEYGEAAAQVAAGMLPGAGIAEAPQNYAAGNEAFAQGNVLGGLGQYAMGAYNQATDFIPGTPTLAAAAALPAATRAQQLQGVSGIYEPTTKLLPDRQVDWGDLQGKVIIPVQGDRTQAGQRLLGTQQDGLFSSPVDLQGGRNFARAEAAQGPDASGWASTASGAKPLYSRTARVAEETGRDPVWAYMPLSSKSSDFTRLGWRAYEQLLRQRGGEAAMPVLAKDMPFEPSIEAMRNWFERATGGERSTAFKKLATKGRVQASGVDPDEVRGLIRDPGLEAAREGDVGHGFIRPTGTITGEAAIPHMDYSHQLGGEYMGRFAPGREVPQHIAFSDVFSQNPAWHQMPQQAISHGFKTKLPYQVVDQQMVDRLMNLQHLYSGGR